MIKLNNHKYPSRLERVLIAQGISGVQILAARGSSIELDIKESGIKDYYDLGFEKYRSSWDGEIGLYVIEFKTKYLEDEFIRKNVMVRFLTENEWSAFASGPEILYEMWGDIETLEEYQKRCQKQRREK